MIVRDKRELDTIRKNLYYSAEQAVLNIKLCAEQNDALGLLSVMKFGELGVDPLKGTSLNLIEQLNMLFTNLVITIAAEKLMERYPDKAFELHMGTEAGYDVESVDGEVVAECFAVTRAASNGKLKKDSEKLIAKAGVQKKYIIFYSEHDTDSSLERVYDKFPEITYVRIKKLI